MMKYLFLTHVMIWLEIVALQVDIWGPSSFCLLVCSMASGVCRGSSANADREEKRAQRVFWKNLGRARLEVASPYHISLHSVSWKSVIGIITLHRNLQESLCVPRRNGKWVWWTQSQCIVFATCSQSYQEDWEFLLCSFKFYPFSTTQSSRIHPLKDFWHRL